MPPELFENTPEVTIVDPSKDYYQELVGEDKKFKDNLALARAKVEADAFIERLKREQQDLRTELESRLNMESFLDQLKAQQVTPPPTPTNPGTPRPDERQEITPDTLSSMLDTVLTERQRKEKATANLTTVKSELQTRFGPNYNEVVKQKSAELNLSEPFLGELAKESPAAFLNLIGGSTRQPVQSPVPPRNQMNFDSAAPSPGRDQNYYRELRKKDPKTYYSPAIQMQMQKDAIANPGGFFKE